MQELARGVLNAGELHSNVCHMSVCTFILNHAVEHRIVAAQRARIDACNIRKQKECIK